MDRDAFAALQEDARRSELNVGSGRMAWRSWGEGHPVVLVHGAAGSWTHWAAVIPDVSTDHLVVAPDLPGYGESDAPADLDDIEALIEGLSRLVAHVGSLHGPVTLVGFSFGGIVSTLSAARTRIRRLGLMSVGGIGMPAHVADATRPRPSDEIGGARHDLERFMIAEPSRVDDLAIEFHLANVASTRFRSGKFPSSRRVAEALPSLDVELHVACSDRDAWSAPDALEPVRRVRELRPEVPITMIEGAGHWAPHEQPEQVIRWLRGVLDAQPGGAIP